ncbi:MmgE/PrpD family protein [Paraflavisolibacter sp. H34]|uniref:MmgE/PrpD family protein n=1 Tax=Huijunlia imazamoxiresistens TaxID=3127457 RepID=UPI00301ADDEA
MSQNFPQTLQIAHFALQAGYDALPGDVTRQLKKHLLYAAGSLFASLRTPSVHRLAGQIRAFSEGGPCTVPLLGATAPDRAAQWYTALLGYSGSGDDFLAKGASCQPSDNAGALLAAAHLSGAGGRQFLTALAVAYEVECRLATELPAPDRGYDDALYLAVSLTAALGRLLSLTPEQTAHALGMAAASFNTLGISTASYTNEWEGLSASLVALGCMNLVFLAKEGVTGPQQVFEGPMGLKELFGRELKYHWEKDHFELVGRCFLKKYGADVHLQSLVEAVLALRGGLGTAVEEIDTIDVRTYLTAYHLAGGGDFGNRKEVFTPEQARFSIPYVLAVALIDGEAGPGQFLPERINRPDVQGLLKKVTVHTASLLHHPSKIAGLLDTFTESYPEALLGKVTIRFRNGREITEEKEDYPGFFTRPFSWEEVAGRFRNLSAPFLDSDHQQRIIDVIADLEHKEIRELTGLLAAVPAPEANR